MTEQSKINNAANRLTTTLFIIYLIALYWILLLKLGVRFSYMGSRRTNLIPFSEHVLLNSQNILNVIIFVPLGIYLGILFERWIFAKTLFFVFFVSLIVEVLQYILRLGAFDVTDIITNTLGGSIGIMILKAIEKVFNNSGKTKKLVNIIAATGTIIMILLLVLLKKNMLPIKYH